MIIDDIKLAAKIIADGGVAAFPTETVYGLGASAYNNEACAQIYAIKGRPQNNPLIVHVLNLEEALKIGEFTPLALKLTSFWPGPLTIVVKAKEGHALASNLFADLGTIAIRVPLHPIAQDLIRLAKCPIAAPSANKSGYISATNAAAVDSDFDSQIAVLNGDATYGIESTIVKAYDDVAILRHGFITSEAIEGLLNMKLSNNNSTQQEAPGMSSKHYSPKTSLILNNTNYSSNDTLFLTFGNVMAPAATSLNLSPQGKLIEAAANLYAHLRHLDTKAQQQGYKYIAVSPIPHNNIGVAINDRLQRAAL
jgi:L-threonylcarbamoyladenylate synthase